jgi:hypothetical protein
MRVLQSDMDLSLGTGLRDARFNMLAQDLMFEFGEDGNSCPLSTKPRTPG